MSNLIFSAYAFDDTLQGSANDTDSKDKSLHIYMKNVIVALVSAKLNNSNCDVALVTNIEVPMHYADMFQEYGVHIHNVPFDSFNFGSNYKWGLAFYKLCALKAVLGLNYDNYLLLDTDTYTFSSIDDLWKLTEYDICLYDNSLRLTVPNCEIFNEEVKKFTGKNRTYILWGGVYCRESSTDFGVYSAC